MKTGVEIGPGLAKITIRGVSVKFLIIQICKLYIGKSNTKRAVYEFSQ